MKRLKIIFFPETQLLYLDCFVVSDQQSEPSKYSKTGKVAVFPNSEWLVCDIMMKK